MEGYVQLFSKNAKLSRFLTINVTATNNSAANVAGGAETGNDKDDKVVMEEESEKEKKPWKCLGGSNCYVIEFIVSYREITDSRFSLNQSKPCIFKVSGPNKSNKERLK